MIVKTLTDEYTFWEWQQQSDTYKDQFSLEGAKALFNYFDELSDDIGEPLEFDPIAWLCDFTEYDSFEEIKTEFSDGNEKLDSIEDLQDLTTVIQLDNGHIILGEF